MTEEKKKLTNLQTKFPMDDFHVKIHRNSLVSMSDIYIYIYIYIHAIDFADFVEFLSSKNDSGIDVPGIS